MKFKKVLLIAVTIGVAYMLYGAFIGVSEPVDDFTPVFPVMPPQQEPPDIPAAVVTFSYSFWVISLGDATGQVTSFTANIETYDQYDQMRVYERVKFGTGWFGPPPSASVTDLKVNITMGGPGGQYCWEKDIGSFQNGATISGESGRAVIWYEGSYGALLWITALVDGQFTVLCGQSITVEVSV